MEHHQPTTMIDTGSKAMLSPDQERTLQPRGREMDALSQFFYEDGSMAAKSRSSNQSG